MLKLLPSHIRTGEASQSCETQTGVLHYDWSIDLMDISVNNFKNAGMPGYYLVSPRNYITSRAASLHFWMEISSGSPWYSGTSLKYRN